MTTIRKLHVKARLATNVIFMTLLVGGASFLVYSNRRVSTVEAVRSRDIVTLFENSKEAFYNRRMMGMENLGEVQNGSDRGMIASTEMKKNNQTTFTNPESIPIDLVNSLDAIYILGGDNPLSARDPSVSVQRAIEDVTSLLERKSALRTSDPLETSLTSVVCLSTGNPKISGSSVISQAAISAFHLLRSTSANGTDMIEPENVLIETSSMDILGSAFYSRTQFADHNEWKNILIVTNQLRLAYTKMVFEWIYGLDGTKGVKYNLYFLAPPDIVVETPPLTTSLQNKVELVKNELMPQYKSMRDLWKFINQEHKLYSAKHLDGVLKDPLQVK